MQDQLQYLHNRNKLRYDQFQHRVELHKGKLH